MRRLKCNYVSVSGLIVLFLLMNFNGKVLAKGKASYLKSIREFWSTDTGSHFETASKEEQKISSLIIYSNQNKADKLTMLIAYNKEVTRSIQNLLDRNVTPLVCSISTLPFESAEFAPDKMIFEQNGRWWSPDVSGESMDLFAIGNTTQFGGTIDDTEVQQGVILLPGWFDVKQPIYVVYKGIARRKRFANR